VKQKERRAPRWHEEKEEELAKEGLKADTSD